MSATSSTDSGAGTPQGRPGGGYRGKLLFLDLTTGSRETRDLDEDTARRYLGGVGLGARTYLDLVGGAPMPEPLSPENPVVLMTCPLTGVKADAVGADVWGEPADVPRNIGDTRAPRLSSPSQTGTSRASSAAVHPGVSSPSSASPAET